MRRVLLLAIPLALAACVPDAILDAEDALLAGPQGTVVATETPFVLPTPGVVTQGVLADRALVRMDSAGRLVARLGDRDYHVRFVETKQAGWSAELVPVARGPPGG